MRRAVIGFLSIVLLSVAVAATASGGDASRPEHRKHPHVVDGPDPSVQLARAQGVVDYVHLLDVQHLADYLHALAVADVVRLIEAQEAAAATAAPIPSPATSAPVSSPTAAWPASLYPCGGDLPPCYVKQRESGGDYNAQNPTSSASGAWQFLDSTWNGYGGYSRAVYAPPDVQDAKAREVWAGGAGCSHWSAC